MPVTQMDRNSPSLGASAWSWAFRLVSLLKNLAIEKSKVFNTMQPRAAGDDCAGLGAIRNPFLRRLIQTPTPKIWQFLQFVWFESSVTAHPCNTIAVVRSRFWSGHYSLCSTCGIFNESNDPNVDEGLTGHGGGKNTKSLQGASRSVGIYVVLF